MELEREQSDLARVVTPSFGFDLYNVLRTDVAHRGKILSQGRSLAMILNAQVVSPPRPDPSAVPLEVIVLAFIGRYRSSDDSI